MKNKAIQSHPYISVITINFNDCIGLERTIQSVVLQTYSDFEYIIIDGGSTDGSKEVIENIRTISAIGYPNQTMAFTTP